MMPIHSDDKELFRKCREMWNKITQLLGINNAQDFVETTLDDGDEFIMVDVHKNTSFVGGNYRNKHKNTSFVGGNYRNKLVIVLHSVIDDYFQTSLVQHRY